MCPLYYLLASPLEPSASKRHGEGLGGVDPTMGVFDFFPLGPGHLASPLLGRLSVMKQGRKLWEKPVGWLVRVHGVGLSGTGL